MSRSFARIVLAVSLVFFAAFFSVAGLADSQGWIPRCRWPAHVRFPGSVAPQSALSRRPEKLLPARGRRHDAGALARPPAGLHRRSLPGYPGKTLLSSLVLMPMILPPFVGAIGNQADLRAIRRLNALLIATGARPAGWTFDWFAASPFWGVALVEALSLYPLILPQRPRRPGQCRSSHGGSRRESRLHGRSPLLANHVTADQAPAVCRLNDRLHLDLHGARRAAPSSITTRWRRCKSTRG